VSRDTKNHPTARIGINPTDCDYEVPIGQ
jgi:hypothetical protein